MRASGESPPIMPPLQCKSWSVRDTDTNWKPSSHLVQPSSNQLFSGPTWLLQDCLHKSIKTLPSIHQPLPASNHHTSLNVLHHTCQTPLQRYESEHIESQFAHHFYHHLGNHRQPSSGHHTCPGFLHHRDSSSSVKPEAAVKLSSRSSSYEKSSVSKSASSSKAASPMPSPYPSSCPSPCPSPCSSLIIPATPPCSPDQTCPPPLNQKFIIADTNRLSADSRPQQKGTLVCRVYLLLFPFTEK